MEKEIIYKYLVKACPYGEHTQVIDLIQKLSQEEIDY